MTNSIEQITERFALLPEDAKKAIHDFDYNGALKQIHDTHKLHIDQAAALEKIVADILFGDTHSTQIIGLLQKDLRLDTEKATQIAVEVNTKILLPIQEKMREIQATI
jgi:hypothetical protein